MASRREYEMLFQLNAQMGGSYNATFNKAQAEVARFQKEIQALSKTQSDISAFQKQQSSVEATRQKLAVLQPRCPQQRSANHMSLAQLSSLISLFPDSTSPHPCPCLKLCFLGCPG